MSAVGYAVLPITPSLKGLTKQLNAELLKPAQAAAKRAAGDINKQLADGAKKAASDVAHARKVEEQATQAVVEAEKKAVAARNASERAAKTVESSELNLKATREKAARDVAKAESELASARKAGDPSKIAAAESRLVEVRSKADASIITRENQLSRARDGVASSSDKVASAERDVASAKDKAAEAAENVTAATKRMDSAQDGAASSTADLARGFTEADSAASGFTSKLGDIAKAAGGLVGLGGIGATLMEGFQGASAISTMTDQLGLTGEAARQLGTEVRDVMGTGVAASAQDAAEAVGALASQFDHLGFEGEQTAGALADNFLAMSKTFQIDMAEATQTAGQLITNGLAPDVESAADLMTAAFQRVPAQMRGELPEIINEYGTNFRALGFSGEEAFGLLVSAADQGKWALDKTGDALKEFTIRGSDMSKASVDAYALVGLSADDMATKIAQGGAPAREALMETAQGLLRISDPAERANAAIALFGTPLEDLSVDQIPQFLEGLTGSASAMDGFQGASQRVADSISGSLQGRMDALKNAVTGVATDGFMRLWDAGEIVANWARDNGTWLGPLVTGLGTMAGIIGSIVLATKLWTAAKAAHATVMAIATGQQVLFNTALLASPVTWIVAGLAAVGVALWAFFTKTETGRKLWDKLTAAFTTGWEWVKGAFATAWEFIQPILDGLWETLKVVGAVLFTAVVVPFQVGWNLVSTAISWAWTSVIQPVWEAMKVGLGFLGQAFSWVWNTVIKPVWDALGAGIRWVWDTIVRPAWDGMKIGLDLLGQAFSWAWNNVIKPIWDGLGAGIKWVADTVIHPVFDGIQRGLDLVKSAFRVAVDVIGTVWNEIREKTAAPIRFVIDTVYNKGIVAVWNKVAGWLGMDDKKLESMSIGFARGGVLPGYTPGRDVHRFINPVTGQGLHLSGGEAIMRPEWTRAVGGPAAVDRMNRDARSGRLPLDEREALRQTHRHAMGGVLAFANGGVVGEGPIVNAMIRIVQQKYPQMHMTSGRIGRADANHGRGMAADFAWPGAFGPHPAQLSLANDIADTYPGSMELIYGPGFARQIKNGAIVGDGGGSYGFYAGAGDHSNHVHWAMNVPPTIPFGGGVFEGGSDGSGGGGGGMSAIGGMVRSAMDAIMGPIMDSIPEGPGLIGGLGKGFGGKLWDEFKGWVLSKVPSGGGGQYGDIDLSGVAGDNLAIGKAAAEQVGWTGAEWEALKELWTGESGWNNNAQNPTSTAYGIAQFLDQTWAPYGPKTADRKKQIEYGIRYIQNRYGTPSAALAFWKAQSPHWYDQGGILPPGASTVINGTGKPEMVFTNPQWNLIKSLILSTAELLDPLRILARDGRDGIEHLAQIADDTRRGVQHQIDAGVSAAGAAMWAALPREVKDAVTVAEAVGRQWEKVSGYLDEKAVAWSRGEWPIGSGRVAPDDPGPKWRALSLDDSLQDVARSNIELAEQVIAGDVSPGRDPAANAIYDVFGRDPLLPDLARIAAAGPNAIDAATDAALHAFETGETARLEEWTSSTSQLTEAVLRARDATIAVGDMVAGAMTGFWDWAMASDTQGRQGSWQEYFQHYGGEYGSKEADWLLGQFGFGGIIGGKFKDSFANLLIETAQSPILAAPPILDDDGRVIGTQLEKQQAAATGAAPPPETAGETADATTADTAATADLLEPAPIDPEGAAGKTIQVTVTLPEDKTAYTAEEVTGMLTKIDEDVDAIKIEVKQMKNEPADVTTGVSLMV